MSAAPVRPVVWACDCRVGGGDRHALVHHQGCASQGDVSRLPLALVVTDSVDERQTIRVAPRALDLRSWKAPPAWPDTSAVETVVPARREVSL